jgi:hypothetical protein
MRVSGDQRRNRLHGVLRVPMPAACGSRAVRPAPMICPSCGTALNNGSEMCGHHTSANGDGWSIENRAICDFIHRKIEPPRLAKADRELEYQYGEGMA